MTSLISSTFLLNLSDNKDEYAKRGVPEQLPFSYNCAVLYYRYEWPYHF